MHFACVRRYQLPSLHARKKKIERAHAQFLRTNARTNERTNEQPRAQRDRMSESMTRTLLSNKKTPPLHLHPSITSRSLRANILHPRSPSLIGPPAVLAVPKNTVTVSARWSLWSGISVQLPVLSSLRLEWAEQCTDVRSMEYICTTPHDCSELRSMAVILVCASTAMGCLCDGVSVKKEESIDRLQVCECCSLRPTTLFKVRG